MVMLYKSPNSPHRMVFTDGRELPKDPNPTWLGYSVGRWEGDTLVVTTAGFNDLGWLDSAGHPQTESLKITERMRRRDFGHMDFEITIDDPKVFTHPFTIKAVRLLAADTEILEDVCENETDGRHLSGDSGIDSGRSCWRRTQVCTNRTRPRDRGHRHRRPAVRARSQRTEASPPRAIGNAVHVDRNPDGI